MKRIEYKETKLLIQQTFSSCHLDKIQKPFPSAIFATEKTKAGILVTAVKL